MRKKSRVYDNADVGCDAARLLAALPDPVQPSFAPSGTHVHERLQITQQKRCPTAFGRQGSKVQILSPRPTIPSCTHTASVSSLEHCFFAGIAFAGFFRTISIPHQEGVEITGLARVSDVERCQKRGIGFRC